MVDPILEAENIEKSYMVGGQPLPVLRGISLQVRRGEAVGIVGASGAGKSTLLHILGGIDLPDRGIVRFEGRSLSAMSDEELAKFRNENLGFVFQFHHLMAELSALENVSLPLRIAGMRKSEAEEKAASVLQRVEMSHRLHHYPSELSGGELQRVAIARALARSPKLLLVDEPTGNLDSANSQKIQDLFFRLHDELGVTLVVVTHDPAFAARFPRVLRMKDGGWSL
ncbi:MAG: ABC transporter ATP-binding protein [Bdellovibrionaceae bacterium]|nr:ABC transporter ATP-binding protein [Pseudobdellovibrionaceae bacterium]